MRPADSPPAHAVNHRRASQWIRRGSEPGRFLVGLDVEGEVDQGHALEAAVDREAFHGAGQPALLPTDNYE
jgi:hypothetical protein